MSACKPSAYEPPPFVDTLHHLPRYDIFFQKVQDPQFDPDIEYLEGLGGWAIIVAAFSILLLIIALLYLVCKCCCFPAKRRILLRKPRTAWAWLGMFFIAFLAASAVGTAMYGGAQALKGTETVINDTKDINQTLDHSKSEVNSILGFGKEINADLGALLGLIPVNETVVRGHLTAALSEVAKVLARAEHIEDDVAKVQLDSYIKTAEEFCVYWEYGMIPFFCLLGLVVLVPFVGFLCCRKTSGCLKFSAFLAVISILCSGLGGGLVMGVTLAGSDVCMDPDGYLLNATDGSTKNILEYYVYCNNCSFPFSQYFDDALQYTTELESLFETVNGMLDPGPEKDLLQHAGDNLENCIEALQNLQEMVNCEDVNTVYHDARHTLCQDVMFSFAILLLAVVASSVPLMVLVMCEQNTWRKITQLKWYHMSYDDDSHEGSPLIGREVTQYSYDDPSATSSDEYPPKYETVESDGRNEYEGESEGEGEGEGGERRFSAND